MKIGIIVAMDKEFVQLKALLENATMEQHHKRTSPWEPSAARKL